MTILEFEVSSNDVNYDMDLCRFLAIVTFLGKWSILFSLNMSVWSTGRKNNLIKLSECAMKDK